MSDVLVMAEQRDGELRPVTFETIAAATELATDGVSVAIVAPDADTLATDLSLADVDTVYAIDTVDEYNRDRLIYAIEQLVGLADPELVVGGNTVNGLDLFPAVAERLGWPIVSDVIDVADADAPISLVREEFGSKVESTVSVSVDSAVVTVRPNEWEPHTESGDTAIETPDIDLEGIDVRTTVTGYDAVESGGVDISEADVLVSVGRGIDEEENLSLVEDLADALGATLSASRPIVDSGWLPKDRQVGQSGKTVTPDVYIAIGISGAVQHVAGMSGAETIVAINTDPDAPIFDIADIGIVDDLFDVVPALIESLESA